MLRNDLIKLLLDCVPEDADVRISDGNKDCTELCVVQIPEFILDLNIIRNYYLIDTLDVNEYDSGS